MGCGQKTKAKHLYALRCHTSHKNTFYYARQLSCWGGLFCKNRDNLAKKLLPILWAIWECTAATIFKFLAVLDPASLPLTFYDTWILKLSICQEDRAGAEAPKRLFIQWRRTIFLGCKVGSLFFFKDQCGIFLEKQMKHKWWRSLFSTNYGSYRVFENLRKSLIYNWERSELCLHFEGTKVHWKC